jgi:bifunctional DNA-binding transcriptional regulator/antitoxin component of YhaV-PrlF toxin-antitoxin module
MPKVSSKRQITLPIEQCQELEIHPGDDIETFVYEGRITIVKKQKDAAKGVLSHLKGKASLSDEESLQDAVDGENGRGNRVA